MLMNNNKIVGSMNLVFSPACHNSNPGHIDVFVAVKLELPVIEMAQRRSEYLFLLVVFTSLLQEHVRGIQG